jgi:hypothetical protein
MEAMKRNPNHFDQITSPQAQEICKAWARIMGVTLSPGRVTKHLAQLAEWAESKRKILEKKVK